MAVDAYEWPGISRPLRPLDVEAGRDRVGGPVHAGSDLVWRELARHTEVENDRLAVDDRARARLERQLEALPIDDTEAQLRRHLPLRTRDHARDRRSRRIDACIDRT